MTRNPASFSPRAAAALVLVGVVLFVALLWQVGGGLAASQINNGEGHAGGKGLNGFAGLARLLASSGQTVVLGRDEAAMGTPGVLVLTPPPLGLRGGDLDRAVARHRQIGPVVVIAPKWMASPLSGDQPGAQPGWVWLWSTHLPEWPDFLDDVSVELRQEGKGARRADTALNAPAPVLPDGNRVEVGSGARLIPLADASGHILAARYDETITLPGDVRGDDRQPYPLYLVFDPDLLDNYGLSHAENAQWAEAFFAQVEGHGPRRVTFDLTFNGLGRQPNLLTLAFMPPYLTATLVLALALAAALWRGLLRFGPVAQEGLATPLGKASLLGQAGAIILRARRYHVLGPPYAEAARLHLARALSLPRQQDAANTDAAIDRALATRGIHDLSFSDTASRLSRAGARGDVLDLAARLHAIERILTP
ncbi:MAG: DUF4350 domain-containing protein [Sphingomonadales bacterium]|nr:DUF4350 domain-containing protein [Sphingomonadales bacterium]MDE2168750.1 DUF4350 domain-containing protein [Sphingomonadales bacterium]